MKRNRICFLLGLLIFAVTSVNGQILKDLEQYQYTYTQTDQLDQAIKEAIINSISLIGSEKYIHDITSIEVAACTKKKNLKDFLKKARKIIKKEKISQLQSTINDDMTVEIYAKDGEIIILSIIDDFATITVMK